MKRKNERTAMPSFHLPDLKEVELDETVQSFIEKGVLHPETKQYKMGPVKIFVSPPNKRIGWHMQVICENRYPTFEEIMKARLILLPKNSHFLMVVPNLEEYMGGKFSFMLYEGIQPTQGVSVGEQTKDKSTAGENDGGIVR